MKTAQELAGDFFDGPGRKMDLIAIIESDRREVRAAALREAAEMVRADRGEIECVIDLEELAMERGT